MANPRDLEADRNLANCACLAGWGCIWCFAGGHGLVGDEIWSLGVFKIRSALSHWLDMASESYEHRGAGALRERPCHDTRWLVALVRARGRLVGASDWERSVEGTRQSFSDRERGGTAISLVRAANFQKKTGNHKSIHTKQGLRVASGCSGQVVQIRADNRLQPAEWQ